MKETLTRSPEKGFALRIVIDLTPEETANEVKGRAEQIRQLQGSLEALRALEDRQAKLVKLVGA